MTRRAGIILAGGSGSRMSPITDKVNKHLLPVYDKPVISYPLEVMRVLDVDQAVIVCNERDQASYADASDWLGFWDLQISTAVQPKPDGLASAVYTARSAFGGESFDQYIVSVGDGVYVTGLDQVIGIERRAKPEQALAWVVIKEHSHPQDFGVVAIDAKDNVTAIVEKPNSPPSSFVCTGLYIFAVSLFSRIDKLTYSARGELEMSDLLESYLGQNQLRAIALPDDVLWFDVGTPDRLLDASIARRESLMSNK